MVPNSGEDRNGERWSALKIASAIVLALDAHGPRGIIPSAVLSGGIDSVAMFDLVTRDGRTWSITIGDITDLAGS